MTIIRMQTTTITLTNSEKEIIKKALDLFDDSSIGFSSTVRDILYKLNFQEDLRNVYKQG